MKHLPHLEDTIFTGRSGFDFAYAAILELHNGLLGRKKVNLSTKMDGAPAIVFGYHPENKKFFISTKSFWNKTPKINYTVDDINANHPNEDLRRKLQVALEVLPLAVKEGVFQGDIMYTAETIKWAFEPIFTPNTITYKIPAEHTYIKAAAMYARIGIAVHTQFRGKSMHPQYEVDYTCFNPTSVVHVIDTRIDLNKICYHHYDQTYTLAYLANAEQYWNSVRLAPLIPQDLELYVSKCINQNKTPAAKDYERHSHWMRFLEDDMRSFTCLFQAYENLRQAKNTLMAILDKHSPFVHAIHGEPSKPEGYVLALDGRAVKLVDRYEFSRINQLHGRFRNAG